MKRVFVCLFLISFLFPGEVNYGNITEEIEIVRVYDGDTFYINVPAWPDIVGKNIAVRVYGIDTPEIRTRDRKEKKLGYQAKELVQEAFRRGETIELKNCKRGKYFRIIAEVWIDGIDLSEYLIEKGLAYRYDGGTKNPPW